jgi:tetratricopeptide (TPR) repeat protein
MADHKTLWRDRIGARDLADEVLAHVLRSALGAQFRDVAVDETLAREAEHLESLYDHATAHFRNGRWESAWLAQVEALALLQTLVRAEPARWRAVQLRLQAQRALTALRLNRRDEASAAAREGVQLAERLGSMDLGTTEAYVTCLEIRGQCSRAADDLQGALQDAELALRLLDRMATAGAKGQEARRAALLATVSWCRLEAGDAEAACPPAEERVRLEESLARIEAPDDRLAVALLSAFIMNERAGSREDARRFGWAAMSAVRRAPGLGGRPGRWALAEVPKFEALCRALGANDEAEAALDMGLDLARAQLATDAPAADRALARTLYTIGLRLGDYERDADAMTTFTQVVEILRGLMLPNSPNDLLFLSHATQCLGLGHLALGRPDAGEAALREALRLALAAVEHGAAPRQVAEALDRYHTACLHHGLAHDARLVHVARGHGEPTPETPPLRRTL